MKKLNLFLIYYLLIFNFSYAIDYSGLTIIPYQEQGQSPRSWFVYKDIKAGSVLQDKIFVANTSNKPVELLIYPVDAQTTVDGAFAPNADDTPRTGISSWIKLENYDFILNPKESKIINFTIKIPEKVAIGDHIGTIIVRSKETSQLKDEQTGLAISIRIGVRVYLTIGGQLIKELVFENLTFNKSAAGKSFFNFTLANNGNVRLTPKGKIEIFNLNNQLVDNFDIDLREIFPYTRTIVPIEWKNPVVGNYKAKATVTSEAGQVLTRELEFKYGDAVKTASGSPVNSITYVLDSIISKSSLINLLVGVGIVIVALLIIIIFLLIFRKRKE